MHFDIIQAGNATRYVFPDVEGERGLLTVQQKTEQKPFIREMKEETECQPMMRFPRST